MQFFTHNFRDLFGNFVRPSESPVTAHSSVLWRVWLSVLWEPHVSIITPAWAQNPAAEDTDTRDPAAA